MTGDQMSDADIARCASVGVPVNGVYGDYYWLASVDANSLPPTDAELAIIRSYIEFTATKGYNAGAAKRLLDMPLAHLAGHNGLELRKDADSWRYQRPTWTTARFPHYSGPGAVVLYPYLADLLDKIEDLLPEKWQTWKAEHPDILERKAI